MRRTTLDPSTVLFLAANPASTNHLALDEEARDIEAKIRAAEHRDALRLKTRWAVRPDDLLQALNEDRPVVVHFSGHGSGAPGLVLHDEGNGHTLVTAKALSQLFTTLKDGIRVVVLNACYAEEQARAIVGVIDCVVGMKDSIGDDAAAKFAASFYRGLGFGRSVQNAFNQGVTAISLAGLGDEDIPQLLVRDGVDATRVVLVSPPVPLGWIRSLVGNTSSKRRWAFVCAIVLLASALWLLAPESPNPNFVDARFESAIAMAPHIQAEVVTYQVKVIHLVEQPSRGQNPLGAPITGDKNTTVTVLRYHADDPSEFYVRLVSPYYTQVFPFRSVPGQSYCIVILPMQADAEALEADQQWTVQVVRRGRFWLGDSVVESLPLAYVRVIAAQNRVFPNTAGQVP